MTRFDPFAEVTVDPRRPIRKTIARDHADVKGSIGSLQVIDHDAVRRRTDNARVRFAALFGLLTLSDLAEIERRRLKFQGQKDEGTQEIPSGNSVCGKQLDDSER